MIGVNFKGKGNKMEQPVLEKLAENLGGTIEEVVGPLPDGSGFAVMSMPLPKDHWLYKEGTNDPPMPFRLGTDNPLHKKIKEMIWEAGRYAVRAATDNGKEMDFDPDALVQNLVVGLIGYHTSDGLSHIDD